MRILLLLTTLASTSLAIIVPAKLHHVGGNKPQLVTHSLNNGNSTVDIQFYANLALVGTLGIGTPGKQQPPAIINHCYFFDWRICLVDLV